MIMVVEVFDIVCVCGVMIVIVESCIGGLIVGWLIDMFGFLDVFECGFVIYFNFVKIEMLGICFEMFEVYGVVSELIVVEMVVGVLVCFKVGIVVLVMGVVGFGGMEYKFEGCVCFGIVSVFGIYIEIVDFGVFGCV